MMANVGKIRNQGIELLLSGTPIKTRDLRFDITGTFSYNKNKIISLSNGLYQKIIGMKELPVHQFKPILT